MKSVEVKLTDQKSGKIAWTGVLIRGISSHGGWQRFFYDATSPDVLFPSGEDIIGHLEGCAVDPKWLDEKEMIDVATTILSLIVEQFAIKRFGGCKEPEAVKDYLASVGIKESGDDEDDEDD